MSVLDTRHRVAPKKQSTLENFLYRSLVTHPEGRAEALNLRVDGKIVAATLCFRSKSNMESRIEEDQDHLVQVVGREHPRALAEPGEFPEHGQLPRRRIDGAGDADWLRRSPQAAEGRGVDLCAEGNLERSRSGVGVVFERGVAGPEVDRRLLARKGDRIGPRALCGRRIRGRRHGPSDILMFVRKGRLRSGARPSFAADRLGPACC
jgi:hypothetical protein